MTKEKKPKGRPVKYPMPERIDASPERIAEVVLGAKPKKVWRYEQEARRKKPKLGGQPPASPPAQL